MSKRYYMEKSPRGFSNEVNTYSFPTKKERDEFVNEFGGNSISRREAMRNIKYKGDAATESYNSELIDIELKYEKPMYRNLTCEPDEEFVEAYRKDTGEFVHGYCRKRRRR